jgi:hypothetical protein
MMLIHVLTRLISFIRLFRDYIYYGWAAISKRRRPLGKRPTAQIKLDNHCSQTEQDPFK